MNSKTDIFLKPRAQVSYLKIQNVLKPLYEGLNFIGRRKDATVIIENQNVSQYHAVITITNDKHYVSDTGSCNGSFLDKDKLQPLLLYELTEGSIIHFACVTAVYVKTPSNSQIVCVSQKNTQNLSESFFGGQTQQLEVEGVEEVFNNCFDDDYDFNDVATTQHVNTVVSIHDMPTQIFSSSHLKIIENCSSNTGSPSIHDLATQIDIQQNNSCNIHEMPTQIILSESSVENEISITTTNINELEAQFIALEKSINLITTKKGKEIEMHERATQINSTDKTSIHKPQQDKEIEICSDLNENMGDSIKKNQEQNNLLNSDKNEDILCQPSTSKGFNNNADVIIDDDCVIEPPEPEHSMVNVSDDIIDDSFLGNVTEVGGNQEYLLLKSINQLTNSKEILSQSPFQVSQPVGFSTIKKQSQPIVYSTSSSSEKGNSPISEDEIVPGQTKSCLRINSDSDTDMEDLPSTSNSKFKKNSKNNNQDDSGSATDIENNLNFIETIATKKVVRKRKKCRKIDSDSETDIENSNIEKFDSDTDIEDVPKISTPSPNKLSLKKQDKNFDITNSDSDTDIEKNETQAVGLSSKITVREEQDSDIIPCTQLSDDDIDDFNFGIGKNATVVEKHNMEDISENFSLRMASYTQLSEVINNSKKMGASVPTNEIQLNIGTDSPNNSKTDQLIIEKLQLVTTKSTPEPPLALPTTCTLISDDLIAQPAEKIIPEKESLFMQPSQPISIEKESDNMPPVQKSSSNSKHIFNEPTQPLSLDDDLFIQPTQEIIQSSKGEVSTSKILFDEPTQMLVSDVNSDDLFMQPTQKMVEISKDGSQDEHLFSIPTVPTRKSRSSSENVFDRPTHQLVPNENCDDDLFMQPTQKLSQNLRSQESVFDHPTQPLNLDDKADDFFLQPTQKIGESSRPITLNEDDGDNLFLQPTQRIISIPNKQKDKEDLFDQPTQVLTIEDDLNSNNESDCDDLFSQPTQKVVSTTNKPKNKHLFDQPNFGNDLFLQTTQQITVASKSKSPLKTFTDNSEKVTSVEKNLRSQESVFDHPTQSLSLNDKVNDFFLQPTQKIGESSRPITLNEDDGDDLFLQPTQVLTIEDNLIGNNENDCDDLFFQPTQKVVSTTSKSKENKHLFDQPTQPLTVEKNLDDDLFLQPTQQIAVASKSKSPLKAFSDSSERGTSVESQLEVMFASQPLLPPANSRPSNPLVSILEGNYCIDSEDTESFNQITSEPVNQNEVGVKESLSSKQDEVITKKETRSKGKVVVKEKVTGNNKDNLVSNEENKSNKRPRRTRRLSMDNSKLENDKMLTRRSQKIEEQEVKNKQSKNEKECSSAVPLKKIEESKISNEDNENEVTVKESVTFKEDEVITRKQTRSREKIVSMKDVTVDDKNKLVSNQEEKSTKQLRSTRKLSVDDAKVINDKMSTRYQRIDSEKIEGSKNEKECSSGVTLKKTEHSKQSNEDNENEVITRKQTRSREKVVSMKDVTVDDKNNLISNQEESTKQLRSARKPSVDDAKVENDKMPTRKNQRTDSIKSSKRIEEQEVKLNKQSKNEKKDSSGGSQKKIDQSNEPENEISKKNIENERLKVQEDNATQETKINTRKRTTRSDSVDSQNTAKIVKKNKNNDKCETSDQTGITKSSSRLRNLKKDPNKLNDVVGASNAIKPSTVTRGVKKNFNFEQPLNDSVMTISSDNSDDDIVLNKPRISKRKQESSQTSSVGSKKIKTLDTSSENVPIAKRNKKMPSKTDAVDEPVNQNNVNETDTSNANSSNSSLRTPIRSRRLSSVGSINDTPNRNKRKQKPKIVFTMLDSPELESLIRSLGGSVVDTVNACTVLVTGSLKRSQKLLSAVGQAKPICSVKWLQECKKMSTFLDPWDFILEDEEAETKWNFSLKNSLIRSQNQKLLENYSILVLVTTAVDVLKAAIESCGGKCVSRAPADTKNFIVVASPENKRKYAKFVKQKVTIVSPEAIFDGVLRQELRFKDHLLS